MIIAIDGPAGSGKSTIAKFIAKNLNYRYIELDKDGLQGTSQAVVGSGTVCVRTFRPEPRYIAFAISDDGPGIPPDERARVFEPFFTTKSDGQGTGLGLSIVRNIIEQHAGRIEIDQADEGGARFTVYLPIRQSRATPA